MVVRKGAGVRIDEALEQFFAFRRQVVSANTLAGDRVALRKVRAALGGNVWVSQLDIVFWRDFFFGDNGGLAGRLKPGSFNITLTRVKVFVRFCADMWPGAVDVTCLKLIKPRPVMDEKRQRLSGEQLVQLVEAAPCRMHRILLALLVNTGLRSSEALGVKVGDVNLAEGEMLVTLFKTNQQVYVPITDDLSRELVGWFAHYEEAMGRPLESDWFVVPAQFNRAKPGTPAASFANDTERVMGYIPTKSPTKPSMIVQRALKTLGLPTANEGGHLCRRSFARLLLDNLAANGDPDPFRMTSVALHHKSLAHTARYTGQGVEEVRLSETLRGRSLLPRATPRSADVIPIRGRSASA